MQDNRCQKNIRLIKFKEWIHRGLCCHFMIPTFDAVLWCLFNEKAQPLPLLQKDKSFFHFILDFVNSGVAFHFVNSSLDTLCHCLIVSTFWRRYFESAFDDFSYFFFILFFISWKSLPKVSFKISIYKYPIII